MWHHGSQCCSHDDRNRFCLYSPHPGYFSLLSASLAVWCFFLPARIPQLTYTIFSHYAWGWYPVCWLAHSCQCGFVDHTELCMDLLSECGCATPWLAHPFHILGIYSNGDIDKFYCVSLDIHVLPMSNNRKLNGQWFPTVIGKFGTYCLSEPSVT